MSNEAKVTVRLLIYSGRPDPQWDLDEKAAEDLKGKFKSAERSGKTTEIPNMAILGYRGFLVNTQGEDKDIPGEFYVFKNTLIIPEGKKATAMQDAANLEQMLLESARGNGMADIVDKIINPDSM